MRHSYSHPKNDECVPLPTHRRRLCAAALAPHPHPFLLVCGLDLAVIAPSLIFFWDNDEMMVDPGSGWLNGMFFA
jgi:hypothetical protein